MLIQLVIIINHLQVDDSVLRRRGEVSQRLRADMSSPEYENIVKERRYWIDIFPGHEGHVTSKVSYYHLPQEMKYWYSTLFYIT